MINIESKTYVKTLLETTVWRKAPAQSLWTSDDSLIEDRGMQ